MAGGDVLAILGCLVLGYLVVGFLMGGAWRKRQERPRASGDGTDTGGALTDMAASDVHPHWSEVLEVSRDAGVDEIRAAYRRLIGEYPPETMAMLAPELRELAERRSGEIVQAYQSAIRERALG